MVYSEESKKFALTLLLQYLSFINIQSLVKQFPIKIEDIMLRLTIFSKVTIQDDAIEISLRNRNWYMEKCLALIGLMKIPRLS